MKIKNIKVENPKQGKNKQIFGSLLVIVGFVFWCISFFPYNPLNKRILFTIAAISWIVGAVIYLSGRFVHWYNWE